MVEANTLIPLVWNPHGKRYFVSLFLASLNSSAFPASIQHLHLIQVVYVSVAVFPSYEKAETRNFISVLVLQASGLHHKGP